MGRLITSILFLFSCYAATAQDSMALRLDKQVPGTFSGFELDVQGNIYLLTAEGGIRKLDRNGDSVAAYNEHRRYGAIHSVDASNPFRVLVHYRNSGTLVILDRLLNPRQVIDLRRLNLLQVRAARLSYDNNIWLYDELAARIRKIDDQGKLLLESADLRNVFPEPPSFDYIFDAERSLYLYDTSRGWYVFDYYGGFSAKYEYPGWQDPSVNEGRLTGREGNCITEVHPRPLANPVRYCPLILALSRKFCIRQGRVYVLTAEGLQIFDAS